MSLHVEILTPSKVLLKGDAEEILAPSVAGEVDIFPQHTDYMTLLSEGKIRVRHAGDAFTEFSISGGVLSVAKDQVKVLVDGLSEESSKN
jgi:F-type H+-transporting ATPase subunit epsilon